MIAPRALSGLDIDVLEVVTINSYKQDTFQTEIKYPKKNYLQKKKNLHRSGKTNDRPSARPNKSVVMEQSGKTIPDAHEKDIRRQGPWEAQTSSCKQ